MEGGLLGRAGGERGRVALTGCDAVGKPLEAVGEPVGPLSGGVAMDNAWKVPSDVGVVGDESPFICEVPGALAQQPGEPRCERAAGDEARLGKGR